MDLIGKLEMLRDQSCDPETVLVLTFAIAELFAKECDQQEQDRRRRVRCRNREPAPSWMRIESLEVGL